jgi:hypothetical protein
MEYPALHAAGDGDDLTRHVPGEHRPAAGDGAALGGEEADTGGADPAGGAGDEDARVFEACLRQMMAGRRNRGSQVRDRDVLSGPR